MPEIIFLISWDTPLLLFTKMTNISLGSLPVYYFFHYSHIYTAITVIFETYILRNITLRIFKLRKILPICLWENIKFLIWDKILHKLPHIYLWSHFSSVSSHGCYFLAIKIQKKIFAFCLFLLFVVFLLLEISIPSVLLPHLLHFYCPSRQN